MTKSIWKGLGGIFCLLLVTLFLIPTKSNVTQSQAEQPTNNNRSFSAIDDNSKNMDDDIWVSEPVVPTISLPINELPAYEPQFYLDREVNPRMNLSGLTDEDATYRGGILGGIDPLLTSQANSPAATDLAFLTPILNYDGQGFTGVNPPDTVGDVGPNHYIQMINGGGGALMMIYDKAGSALAGPTAVDSLGTGACANGLGDGIVLYDQMADRWMISEFSGSTNALCIYISSGSNPVTSSWYVYQFNTPNFPDYPKYGVWTDAYYVSTNETGGPAVYAMDRAKMLAGAPATQQRFTAPGLAGFGFQALIPSDLDGATAPPTDAPNYFMRHRDDEAHNAGSNNPTEDYLEIWPFHVDFDTPANSTFTGPLNIPVSEFDSELCGYVSFQCFPQQGSATTLDPLREVIMQRLQYRNFGAYEVLVGNYVTDVDGSDHGGVRWFELRKSGGGSWTLHQEGTYAPDANSRWMGAISMDGAGNIAVGYNVSSSNMYPSLRYAGRLAGDPLGTLPQGEGTLINGSAANSSNRYGDYSAMSVDPADDCTFWFTGEYNASSTWSTRIGTFKFDSCGSDDFTISATPPELAVCSGTDAVYTVDIGQVGSFSDNVTLSSSGEPVGTTTGFVPNPVTAPSSSQMTISNIGDGAAGNYTIDISGNGSPGTHSAQVDLNVYTAVPTTPTLSSPADTATGIVLSPTFTWTAVAQATSYSIEIATDNGFTNIVDSATGLPTTSYTSGIVLNQQTTYYWRVSADNPCGNGMNSASFSFTTSGTLPGPQFCSTPNAAIPDNDPAGIDDQIAIFTAASLSDLDVYIDTDHTWVGDLIYTLKHVESGTEVTLIDRPGIPSSNTGCSGSNIDATIDDEGTDGSAENMCDDSPAIHGNVVGGDPSNSSLLAAFDGESFNGNWTLTVSDNASQDVGTLKEWCLLPTGDFENPDIVVAPTTIQSEQPANTTTVHTFDINNVGELPLNWVINEANASSLANLVRDASSTSEACENPSDIPWATVTTGSGTTAPANTSEVDVTFNSSGLATGNYSGILCIESNDPDEPLVEVTLDLQVETPLYDIFLPIIFN